jgi:hypothetical protein
MSDEALRKRIDELDAEYADVLPPEETHEELIARLEGLDIQIPEGLEVVPDPDPEPEIVPEPEVVPEPVPEVEPEVEPEEKTADLEIHEGVGVLEISFTTAVITRDEYGRVASLVSPTSVKTLMRDEVGRVIGVHEERERIVTDE